MPFGDSLGRKRTWSSSRLGLGVDFCLIVSDNRELVFGRGLVLRGLVPIPARLLFGRLDWCEGFAAHKGLAVHDLDILLFEALLEVGFLIRLVQNVKCHLPIKFITSSLMQPLVVRDNHDGDLDENIQVEGWMPAGIEHPAR